MIPQQLDNNAKKTLVVARITSKQNKKDTNTTHHKESNHPRMWECTSINDKKKLRKIKFEFVSKNIKIL